MRGLWCYFLLTAFLIENIVEETKKGRVMDGRNNRWWVGVVFLGLMLVSASSESPLAQTFEKGDIFLAVGELSLPAQVDWYRQDGTFVATIWDSVSLHYSAGMAFDSDSNLYVANFGSNSVSRYNNDGTSIGFFGGGYSTPESITFDTLGLVYIGNLFSGIRRYLPDGTFDQTIGLPSTRVDWIDLDASSDTILYTQEGVDIKRVAISNGSDPGNFTTGTAMKAYALQILGEPRKGKVLLADSGEVKLYRANGTVEKTYDIPGENFWFSLDVNPDDSTFWAGDLNTGIAYKFTIDSGNLLQILDSGKGGNRLYGIAVFREITVTGVEEKGRDQWTGVRVQLLQNRPNPFNELTAISYQLRAPSHVSLNIYDLTGRLVKTLVDERQKQGIYQLPITNNQLPASGTYFYRLTARNEQDGDYVYTQKMILLR
jgi:hypothetical protein